MSILRSLALPGLAPGSLPGLLWGCALGVALSPLGGCATQDPVGVRIRVDEDGGGTIAIASLSLPEVTAEVVGTSAQVDWDLRARLDVTSGKFERADGVAVEDLELNAAALGVDGGSLRVVLPCGEEASWFRSLHVDPQEREKLERALGHAISEVELHENVTVSVTIENARVAGSLLDPIPRVTVGSKHDTCTLVVPLNILEERGNAMVLVVNWERSKPVVSRGG
ncbi:MAG: hypothetical protein VX672_10630 [Planctomycetota bacterium]|nr:hypothetical protein [Planctomycetota bacterium]